MATATATRKTVIVQRPNGGYEIRKTSACANCGAEALEGSEFPTFMEPLNKLSRAFGRDLSKLPQFKEGALPEHTCDSAGNTFCELCHPAED